KGYKQLSLEERELLFAWKEKGLPLRTIALELMRSHTTLSRELRRNKRAGGGYIPCSAQSFAYDRLHKQRVQAGFKGWVIYDYVRRKLLLGWSPETIAGRLPLDHPGLRIHHETIYCYIYWRGIRLHLWKLLPLQRRRRMRKGGRRVGHRKIPGALSIDLRPREVNERTSIGHWETDNVVGKVTDKTALSTTVERVTRYTLLSKLEKSAAAKQGILVSRLWQFPAYSRKSLTTDNGSENANHAAIQRALSLTMYFCHAFRSWEKGSVENMNGRIRRYIPKGKSMDTVSEEEVWDIEYALNHTPRKCLGFLTPEEALANALKEDMRTVRENNAYTQKATEWIALHPL
ncbi:MAG: IS30 family transposase, partial [Acidobacteria bacterium]|nr:IS30 family transposase [Acidobacteriota bacterium]